MRFTNAIQLITLQFFGLFAAGLPSLGISHDTTLRHIEGPPSEVLASVAKDSTGAISLGSDGVLRSLSGDGSVIDYRQLDSCQHEAFTDAFGDINISPRDQAHETAQGPSYFADGRTVLNKDQLQHPPAHMIPQHLRSRDGNDFSGAEGHAQDHITRDSAEDPDAACSPPVHCNDSSSCSGGCSTCTWVSFFPYGICMRDGNATVGKGMSGKKKRENEAHKLKE